jgi:two-component system, NarL family, invasion response regulator UvrY
LARILIADDHAVVRAGYRQFLEADSAITEIGECDSGSATLDALRRQKWDLLLMDIHMPGRSGIDILRHVVSGYPDLRVLIMSGLPEEQYARNVLRAGAKGYLSKDGSAQEFMRAIHLVLAGRRYVSAALAEQMAGELSSEKAKDAPLHAQLSEREFQIFCKIAAGGTVSAIAAELSLSVKTISTYRARVLEKMGFTSNADLTAYALRNGLIQ